MQPLEPAPATGREQRCDETENTEPNVLEQLRAECIRQNNAALAACGLEPVKAPACQKQRQLRAPGSCKARPTRQSARLQHVAPEAQPSSPARRRDILSHKLSAPRCEEEQLEYDTALQAHNSYRIKTMSDRALETRVHRITNVDKLRSFVQVLRGACKEQLAQEAEGRLHQLAAGANGGSVITTPVLSCRQQGDVKASTVPSTRS